MRNKLIYDFDRQRTFRARYMAGNSRSSRNRKDIMRKVSFKEIDY